MKQVFLLITTLLSFNLLAQKTKPANRILVGYNFSADYDFRSLKNNDGGNSADLVIKSRNEIEMAKFGYTTGLNIRINLSEFTGLETGIQFLNKGYKTTNQYLVYIPIDPTVPVKAKFLYSYQYVGIPLKAKFSFGKGSIRVIAGIGFTTNLLVNFKQTAIYEYANGRTERKTQSSTSGFNKIDISPMVSAGIDYKLNKKMHLFAEPTFRYGLIKVKDAPVTEKLWNAGFNVGLYYVVK